MVLLCDRPFPVAVTTIGNVPTGELGVAVRIKLPFPATPGAIRDVIPTGRPETLKLILLKEPPPIGVAVKAKDEEPPPCTCMTVEDAEKPKSPLVGLGLN